MRTKNTLLLISWCLAGIVSSAQAGDSTTTRSHDTAASTSSLKGLSESCETMRAAHPQRIHLNTDYEVDVFFLDAAVDTFNFVGIVEKGPSPDGEETAHIKRICLSKIEQPPGTHEGDIVLPSKGLKTVTILFHLNFKKSDPDHLERNQWSSPPPMSLAINGQNGAALPPKPTAPGYYPGCVSGVTVGGVDRADLSFDFSKCLSSGTATTTYAYNLFVLRHKQDGTSETKGIDPQIIIHAH